MTARTRRRSCRPGATAGAALLALSTLLAGCAADPREGWSTAPVHRTDVATVAVPIFGNETFVREVEFGLTDAVIKAIESRTPYTVTARDRADTLLAGRITEVELRQLSASPLSGLGEEVVESITIEFAWTRIDTGEVLVRRGRFETAGLFTPSAPTSERIESGRHAAIDRLANRIVDSMQSEW